MNQKVGAVVSSKSGSLILALENGFYILNLETEELKGIIDPESHFPENRFNDGKCDSYGRFGARTTDLVGIDEKGALYCLDTDLTAKKKLDRVSTSNGIAWSPNNKFMYFTDTPTKKVVRFNYNLQTGNIENPFDIIFFSEGEGIPDGMTIDVEGHLWIAHWGGSKISRWNPETGEQISSIHVPAKYVTSCTFGGSDLSELYITTACIRIDEKERLMYPNAGAVFRLKTNTRACVSYQYKG